MKTVLVTGGAHDLGACLVEMFAQSGYNVIFTYYKSEEEAEGLQKRLSRTCKVKVEKYKVDLTIIEEIQELCKSIEDLDVLVNNAAYYRDDEFANKTSEDFLTAYKVNVIAPFLLAQELGEVLKKNNGAIVNIASTNGIDTMYEYSIDYDASKAALINLTKSLSVILGPKVRVNAVAPGWIDTTSTHEMEPSFLKHAEDSCVMRRFAEPCEIAGVVKFLSSEDAKYLTGSIIRVDGGSKYGNM